jgi:hypothetical protein
MRLKLKFIFGNIRLSALIIFILFFLFVFYNGVRSTRASGPALELLSFFIESNNIPAETTQSQLTSTKKLSRKELIYQEREQEDQIQSNDARLSFYIPSGTMAQFSVKHNRLFYVMRISIEDFEEGFYTFRWGKNILESLKIKLSYLDAIGFIEEKYFPSIVPVILHDSDMDGEIHVQSYSCVFRTAFDGVASIRFVRSGLKSPVFESKVQHIRGNVPFLINWPLGESPGNILPDGTVKFDIAIKGEKGNSSIVSYSFYHKQIISTENARLVTEPRYEGIQYRLLK